MVSRVAIISPHGWFGQDNVLGRPDTGGQIVYILHQVKALDKFLRNSLKSMGLSVQPKIIVLTRLIPDNDGTTSNHKLEKIHGTQNAWILRIPFRDQDFNVIPHWISRFHIWPYLEQFALASHRLEPPGGDELCPSMVRDAGRGAQIRTGDPLLPKQVDGITARSS